MYTIWEESHNWAMCIKNSVMHAVRTKSHAVYAQNSCICQLGHNLLILGTISILAKQRACYSTRIILTFSYSIIKFPLPSTYATWSTLSRPPFSLVNGFNASNKCLMALCDKETFNRRLKMLISELNTCPLVV